MSEPAPNTPILVGVAALQQRFEDSRQGLEPSAMMVEVLRQAAADAGSAELLSRADRIEVPQGIWGYSNPAGLVADALGADAAQTVLAEIGILQQTSLNRACNSINCGEAEVVLVVGAEAKYRSLRASIEGVELSETEQGGAEPDLTLRPDAELWCQLESEAGLGMPVGYYAIMDSALRHRQRLGVDQHRDQMAEMYAGFSRVAAANPDAWVSEEVAAETIRNPAQGNRMLAFPYTRLHNSQWNVDQAAGLIFCSVQLARDLGISPDKWIFPLAGTESNAMSMVAARARLDRSYGFYHTGKRVLELSGKTVDEVDLMELYSCFPQAVRVQLEEFGLSPERALSVTGAMTFAGGPLNNFVLQATAKMAQLLRASPGKTGLVTCVSGMNTKQACALYSDTPNPDGWQFADVSEAVRADTGLCKLVENYEGGATIAGYTVLYQGDSPWRAVAVCDLPNGARTVAYCDQSTIMEALQEGEFCGRQVAIIEGQFS
jgi:acetyl-CoA C-acetyltransferase